MSLVVVGLSHRSAPIPLLERAALPANAVAGLVAAAAGSPHVAEAVVVSTCNRVEVYADVRAFHAGVGELIALLAASADVPVEELGSHVYAHFEDAAVQHLFQVVCGLDSMVVGESQILGQVRGALRTAQRQGAAGGSLGGLVQQALRVGKRAHTETGVDRAAPALVGTGLALTAEVLGSLPGHRALVVGAGSLAGLALAALAKAGVDDVTVLNRGLDRATTLASAVGGRAGRLSTLAEELAAADLVVSCTGATGIVLTEEMVAAALAGRRDRPLAILDLALPRDVDPAAGRLPAVTLVDLEDLGGHLADTGQSAEVDAVRAIVAEEVAAYLARRQADRVAPTVVALRGMAEEVVAGELARFDSRVGELDPLTRAEVERTVRRVVDKVLHAPTVRVKELAEEPAGIAYAEALRTLFDLDPVRYREVVAADVHPVELVDLVEPAPPTTWGGAR
jgi:glutamyl-tRNA reductase